MTSHPRRQASMHVDRSSDRSMLLAWPSWLEEVVAVDILSKFCSITIGSSAAAFMELVLLISWIMISYLEHQSKG